MQHEEEVFLEPEHEPFAHPPQPLDALPLERRRRRLDGPDDEGIADAKPFQRLRDHTRRQCLEVDDNVRQLGHVAVYLLMRLVGER